MIVGPYLSLKMREAWLNQKNNESSLLKRNKTIHYNCAMVIKQVLLRAILCTGCVAGRAMIIVGRQRMLQCRFVQLIRRNSVGHVRVSFLSPHGDKKDLAGERTEVLPIDRSFLFNLQLTWVNSSRHSERSHYERAILSTAPHSTPWSAFIKPF